ncbi:MAG TPA: BON domain-containing protein [Ktedonobacterales bacterium]
MHVTTGPARYFFLRQPKGVKEEVPNWPPTIKPLQQPDNWICVAVYLHAEEHGWRAEAVREESELRADAGGAFLLTRETALGLAPDGRGSATALDLLGVRVALLGEKGPEYATHLVVRATGLGGGKPPVVVPITALVLGGYLEHGDRAEAQLDLRLTTGELASMPPYLPDAAIERQANRALDAVIFSERQRNEIKPEVQAGRVTLYGQTELTAVGELARAELQQTPGVIEVLDRVIYGEEIMDQVREQLAAKGFGHLDVLYEHGLIELSGALPDTASLHRVRDLALRVTGVRGVVTNQVTIEAPAKPFVVEDAPAAKADGATKAKAAEGASAGEAKVSGTKRG